MNPKGNSKVEIMEKFTIGTPCHENWNAMSQADKGRFCDVCAKCVVDLTGKSQRQIKDLYDAADGDLCGRMPVSQAQSNATIREQALAVFNHSMAQLRTFAAAFVMAFAFLLGGQNAVKGQHLMGKIVAPQQLQKTGKVEIHIQGQQNRVEGKAVSIKIVQNSSGEIINHGVTVSGTYSYANLAPGQYEIVASVDELIGFAWLEIKPGKTHSVSVQLQEPRMMLGDVIMIEEPDPVIEIEVEETTENNITTEQDKVLMSEAGVPDDASVQPQNLGLTLFPNPSVQSVTLRLENADWETATISIANSGGQVVWQANRTIYGRETTLQLDQIPSGSYWVTVRNGEDRLTRPLILNH